MFVGVFLKVLYQDRYQIGESDSLLVNMVIRYHGKSTTFLGPMSMNISRFAMSLRFVFFYDVVRLLFLSIMFFSIAFRDNLCCATGVKKFLISAYRRAFNDVVNFRRGESAIGSFTTMFATGLLVEGSAMFREFLSTMSGVQNRLSIPSLFRGTRGNVVGVNTNYLVRKLQYVTSIGKYAMTSLLDRCQTRAYR